MTHRCAFLSLFFLPLLALCLAVPPAHAQTGGSGYPGQTIQVTVSRVLNPPANNTAGLVSWRIDGGQPNSSGPSFYHVYEFNYTGPDAYTDYSDGWWVTMPTSGTDRGFTTNVTIAPDATAGTHTFSCLASSYDSVTGGTDQSTFTGSFQVLSSPSTTYQSLLLNGSIPAYSTVYGSSVPQNVPTYQLYFPSIWSGGGSAGSVSYTNGQNNGLFTGGLSIQATPGANAPIFSITYPGSYYYDVGSLLPPGKGYKIIYSWYNSVLSRTESYTSLFNIDYQLFDFDGDGQTDLFWQNQSTGELVFWFMNGSAYSGRATGIADTSGNLIEPSPSEWRVVGTYHGSQVLWQDKITGELVVWTVVNGQYLGRADINPGSYYSGWPAPGTWRAVAWADLDHDNNPDILWQNQNTGEMVYWRTNGLAVIGASDIGFGSSGQTSFLDPSWKAIGVGTYFEDGEYSIVYQNTVSGDVQLWHLYKMALAGAYDLTTQTGSTIVANPNPQAWHLVGTGDYTGDGVSDLLWQNQSTGELEVYGMEGEVVKSASDITGYSPWPAPGTWQIVGVN